MLKEKLTQLAHEKPRYGYRRLAVLLRREGQSCEPQESVSRVPCGRSERQAKETKAVDAYRAANVHGCSGCNQQWAIDFVHDRMANGRTIRVLSVVGHVHTGMPGFGSGHLFAQPTCHPST